MIHSKLSWQANDMDNYMNACEAIGILGVGISTLAAKLSEARKR